MNRCNHYRFYCTGGGNSAKNIGFNFSGVDAPKNENDLYGLRYAEFVVPLVKAVQELSHQNEAQKN